MKAKFDGNHLLSIENSLKICSNIEICSKILVSINFANLFPPLTPGGKWQEVCEIGLVNNQLSRLLTDGGYLIRPARPWHICASLIDLCFHQHKLADPTFVPVGNLRNLQTRYIPIHLK